MAQSRRTMVLKHMIVMELILSLQDDNGNFINIDYVASHSAGKRGDAIPTEKQARTEALQLRSECLRDMLELIDDDVYKHYHQLLKKGGSLGKAGVFPFVVKREDAESALRTVSAIYQLVSDRSDASMWCNSKKHLSPYIMREVVYCLLS